MSPSAADVAPARSSSLGDVLARARSNWGWFVALGATLIVCGALAAANLLAATVASMFVIATAMIAGGVINVILSFRARNWSRFFLWLAAGLLYVLAGVFIVADPLLASAVFTLFAAVALIAAGALRIWIAFASRPESGWGWILAAGGLSLATGFIIALGWPVNSLWVLGLFLSLDLLLHGWGYVALGLALRARGGIIATEPTEDYR